MLCLGVLLASDIVLEPGVLSVLDSEEEGRILKSKEVLLAVCQALQLSIAGLVQSIAPLVQVVVLPA